MLSDWRSSNQNDKKNWGCPISRERGMHKDLKKKKKKMEEDELFSILVWARTNYHGIK